MSEERLITLKSRGTTGTLVSSVKGSHFLWSYTLVRCIMQCSPPSRSLFLLLFKLFFKLSTFHLRPSIVSSLTASSKNLRKFCSLLFLNVFFIQPSTSTSLVFLHSAPFCFPLTHIISEISSFLWFFFLQVVLPFPPFFLPHRRASPAHHYLSQHPAHCPFLLHFSPGTRNEMGASCPLFIIFHSSFSFFVLCMAMLPPTPPTHLPCGTRLLIRSSEWNSVTLLILRHSTVSLLREVRDGSRGRGADTVGCRLLGFLAESKQHGQGWREIKKRKPKDVIVIER